eukprot:316644-Pyramimonas_sp.AAC.1
MLRAPLRKPPSSPHANAARGVYCPRVDASNVLAYDPHLACHVKTLVRLHFWGHQEDSPRLWAAEESGRSSLPPHWPFLGSCPSVVNL